MLKAIEIGTEHRNNHVGRWNDRGDIVHVVDTLLPTGEIMRTQTTTPMWSGLAGAPRTKTFSFGYLWAPGRSVADLLK